jgi:hypothetical protein
MLTGFNLQINRVIIIALIFALLPGCRYSFNPTAKAPDVKSVTVQYFPNQASIVVPTLSQVFTERLKNKFLTESTLNLVSADGDLNFSGRIIGYTTMPTAQQGDKTAARNRLTITVEVTFVNKKDEKQNFEQQFSGFSDYDSNQNLSAIEARLIKEITDNITQDIFIKALSNW